MPLYTVTMKNGNTFQVRADDKDAAAKLARSKSYHDYLANGPKHPTMKDAHDATHERSIRVNK